MPDGRHADMVQASHAEVIEALKASRAALDASVPALTLAAERLALNNIAGEEDGFIQDCLGALQEAIEARDAARNVLAARRRNSKRSDRAGSGSDRSMVARQSTAPSACARIVVDVGPEFASSPARRAHERRSRCQ